MSTEKIRVIKRGKGDDKSRISEECIALVSLNSSRTKSSKSVSKSSRIEIVKKNKPFPYLIGERCPWRREIPRIFRRYTPAPKPKRLKRDKHNSITLEDLFKKDWR